MNFLDLTARSSRAVVADEPRGPSIGLELSSDVVDLYNDESSEEQEEEAIYTAMPQGEAVEEFFAEERAALSAAQSLSRPVPPPEFVVDRRRHQQGKKGQNKKIPHKKAAASKNKTWHRQKGPSGDTVASDRKQLPFVGFRDPENAKGKRKRTSNEQSHSDETAGEGTPTSKARHDSETQSNAPGGAGEPGLSPPQRKRSRKRKRKGKSDEQAQGGSPTDVTEEKSPSQSKKAERNRRRRQQKRENKRRKAQEAKESSEAGNVLKAAQPGETGSLEKDTMSNIETKEKCLESTGGHQAKADSGGGNLEDSNQSRSSCTQCHPPKSIDFPEVKPKPQSSEAPAISELSKTEGGKACHEIKSDAPASATDNQSDSRSEERKPRAFSTESRQSCDGTVQSHEHVTLQDMREFWDEAHSKVDATNPESKVPLKPDANGSSGVSETQPPCASVPKVDKPVPQVSRKEAECTAHASAPPDEQSTSTVRVPPTDRSVRDLFDKAEPDVIDLSSETDKPSENVGTAKAASAEKSWQSTCVIIDSDSNDEGDDLVTVVGVKRAPPPIRKKPAQSTARQENTSAKSAFHYSPEWFSRPLPKPKKRPMPQQKKDFNFEFSTEAAQQEQERLFAEAAARVREKGLQGNLHVQTGDGPIFTRPVTDLSKLNENHWKWQDPYSRLGLNRGASLAMIKNQYRRLARRYHPDKSNLPDTASRFQAVTEAYHTLSQRSTVL